MDKIRKNARLLVLLIVLSMGFALVSGEPIRLHPDNPHYFLFRDKPTILIGSGEHYGALINLDFDYTAYLNQLQSKGLNLTRTFAGPYVEFAGWFNYALEQPLSPLPGRFICPWARSSTPGYINGGNKFDLAKWDEAYFLRLKDFFRKAADRGIIVEFTLFSPYYNSEKYSSTPDMLWQYSPFHSGNNINGVGAISRTNALTLNNGSLLAIQEAYVRKMVEALKGFDNLIYEIVNEPYIEDLTERNWQAHITKLVIDAESGFQHKHLISQNIANGSAKIDNADPNVSIFNFHYSDPTAVSQNYQLNKVIGNNETTGRDPESVARRNGWNFITGGGGLYNNLDMSFTIRDEAGGSSASSPSILRSQFKVLSQFMESLDFIRMKTDSSFVANRLPSGVSVRALVEPGKAYAVYVSLEKNKPPLSSMVELELVLPTGKYNIVWIDPVTGNAIRTETAMHKGGKKMLIAPVFVDDVAFRIERISK